MRKAVTNQSQVDSATAPGYYRAAKSLYLTIRAHGSKSWLFRYQRGGRAHWVGLGAADVVSLAKARKAALAYRVMLSEGRDPLKEKRQSAPAPVIGVPTFTECCESYISDHEAGWRNEKHRYQWRQTLVNYACPVIGRLPVDKVTVAHIVDVLRPIWTTKAETATRLRGRIERVLDWARAKGYRSGENPAQWKGALSHLLPPLSRVQKVEHHAALPVADAPSLGIKLSERMETSARALLFTMLTAARTSETLLARWSEIDLAARVWTVPKERMKAGRPHRVPLADAALSLLQALPRSGDLIFPGTKRKAPLSNMTMIKLLRNITGDKGVTVHGLRSTFRDWCAKNRFPRELAERALAHAVKNKTEAAYLRDDLLEERRAMMTAWANFCSGAPREGSKHAA